MFRCLSDRITLPDMIGTFTAGTTDCLVAKSQMIFFHILKMLVMILRYLEAKFVND